MFLKVAFARYAKPIATNAPTRIHAHSARTPSTSAMRIASTFARVDSLALEGRSQAVLVRRVSPIVKPALTKKRASSARTPGMPATVVMFMFHNEGLCTDYRIIQTYYEEARIDT